MDVSIVITAYNYEGYLNECISSCLNQEDAGLSYEVLVIDDGSTDGTPAVLADWEHERLRKFRIDNRGIEAASNFGFANAKGDYIVRVDADDLLLPSYLKEMRPYVDARWPFIYSDYQVIDANGHFVEFVSLPEFAPSEISSRGDFLATGTLYLHEVLGAVGGYRTEVRNCGLENYELILTLLRAGHIGKHVMRSIFAYRRHSENISIAKRAQIIEYGQMLFDRLRLGSYRTNEFHPYKLRLLS